MHRFIGWMKDLLLFFRPQLRAFCLRLFFYAALLYADFAASRASNSAAGEITLHPAAPPDESPPSAVVKATKALSARSAASHTSLRSSL